MVSKGVLHLFTLLSISFAATPAAPISVKVSPESASLRLGTARDFNATVSNSGNQAVIWSVNGVDGGSAGTGTIDAEGKYAAPLNMPTPNVVTVKAVAKADTAQSASALVTLLPPTPVISSLAPAQVNTGLGFVITITGSGFQSASTVTWDGAPIQTAFVSSTTLTIQGTTNAAPGTQHKVAVVNPDPGGATSNVKTSTVMAPVTVSVSPEKRTLRGGSAQDFNASVANNPNKGVTWMVNDIPGGNAVVGSINADGLYSAPFDLPNPASATIKAVSVVDPRAANTAQVTLQNPIPAITAVNPGALTIGPLALTLNGSGFARTAKVYLGRSELRTTWVSSSQLNASGDAAAVAGGMSTISVGNPDPGAASSNAVSVAVKPAQELATRSAAMRLLDQAAWGADPETLARVQQIGLQPWLEEQFLLPASTYPDPVDTNQGLGTLQRVFFANAFTGRDQLRQRMAFALGQILVVSGVELGRHHQMVGYQRLLLQHAFGNYLDLLRDVTLSPAMGVFLDMVNNAKEDLKAKTVPNENYARELLQLFSVGLAELNQDGTRRLDQYGQTVPAYSEETVKELTRALTGWTYPTQPGFQARWRNPAYFLGPMEPFEQYHDQSEKVLLNGTVLPAGRSAREDMESAIRNLFEHPNVGPFVSLRLIQRLVTSGPSPAYVSRVAAVFNNNGRNVRGDLKAVARAILLDPEAGNAALTGPSSRLTPLPADQGHLREPVLYAIQFLRALGAKATAEPALASSTEQMGQRLFYAPSVFNYFSPSYRIPGSGAVAPEFQILNPATALARANFIYRAVRNSFASTITVDLSHFEQLAENPDVLVDAVNNALLRGQMTPEMRASILRAMSATTDKRTRARNALYLAGVSSQFQVQR